MDVNSISFQMFLTLLSFISFGPERQFLFVFIFVFFFGGGWGVGGWERAQ